MKVIPLKKNPYIYSCNSYLILGEWNRIEDMNTLIDPGTDSYIQEEIDRIPTGFGKVAVEQIILTHNHFDHAGSILDLKSRFGAKVYAFVDMAGVDELLHHGSFIKAGDDYLEILHAPGHSSDSICLYCKSKKSLFSGDMQLRVRTAGGAYTQEYLESLLMLYGREIETVYSGHDEPLTVNVKEILAETIRNVRRSDVATG
jgi:glyoxylase-like metal-dependent hydrolase (beta-lactamase superfamily II)